MSALSYTTRTTRKGSNVSKRSAFRAKGRPFLQFQRLSSLSRSEALSLTLTLCVCFFVCVYITRRLLSFSLLLFFFSESTVTREVVWWEMWMKIMWFLVQWATKNVREKQEFRGCFRARRRRTTTSTTTLTTTTTTTRFKNALFYYYLRSFIKSKSISNLYSYSNNAFGGTTTEDDDDYKGGGFF